MVDYYDRAGRRVDTLRWAELGSDEDYRRVAEDRIGDMWISTVWLGIDHRFTGDGPPLIFETMVFNGRHDQECTRYCTELEALAGHAAIVADLLDLPADYALPAITRRNYREAHNPEDHVLDAIDELVNEQLAIGPVDDYNADRYVKCARCGDDWHGTPNMLGCVGSDVEGPIYTDQVQSVKFSNGGLIRGYTLADLAAMREDWLQMPNYASMRDPLSGPYAFQEHFTRGEMRTELVADNNLHIQIRLWRTDPDTGDFEELAGVMHIADTTINNAIAAIAEIAGIPILPELPATLPAITQGPITGGTIAQAFLDLPDEQFDASDCDGPF